MTPPANGAIPATTVIIGTGLIGTSVALALRARGGAVYLEDDHAPSLQRAADLGAGVTGAAPPAGVDLVVVAVPPNATVAVASKALTRFPNATVIDVSSVKGPVLEGVTAVPDGDRFVGSHPLAGREVSGPAGARSDLFEGRAWVVAAGDANPERVAQVEALVLDLGATPIRMAAIEHDRSVALMSHVPQLMASLTAARLADASEASVQVAGQGIRDVTRIAASDPDLWADIVRANEGPVLEVLEGVQRDLGQLIEGMRAGDPSTAVRTMVKRGNDGYARIPGKHGDRPQRYTDVPVVIPDQPGALARLFDRTGEADVNIEDLVLEHSPGQPVGLATLRVLPAHAARLIEELRSSGWTVHA